MQRGSPEKKIPAQAVSEKKKFVQAENPPPPHHFSNGPSLSQKDEIPHTARLNDTATPHFKIQITEIPLEKNLNTVSPHFPLHAVKEVIENFRLKTSNYI